MCVFCCVFRVLFSAFCAFSVCFSVRFPVRSFSVRSFSVRSFSVRSFSVRSFPVRSLPVRSLPVRSSLCVPPCALPFCAFLSVRSFLCVFVRSFQGVPFCAFLSVRSLVDRLLDGLVLEVDASTTGGGAACWVGHSNPPVAYVVLLPILESCLQHGQLWKEPLVLQVTTSFFEHCWMSAADHREPGFPSLKK